VVGDEIRDRRRHLAAIGACFRRPCLREFSFSKKKRPLGRAPNGSFRNCRLWAGSIADFFGEVREAGAIFADLSSSGASGRPTEIILR